MSSAPTLYRRPLPPALIAFSSAEGRRLLEQSLAAGHLESFFPLIEQFHTQADPAYCGLGSLVMVLNALAVDPGRVWRGPWRWFSEELLDCCTPLAKVQTAGLTIDEVACLARCNGADVERGSPASETLADFRAALREATSSPERMLIASYDRSTLGQTGAGHFSPIGGYHEARDMLLVLDVARFKYPPHWVAVSQMFEAMRDVDPVTGRARGWLQLRRRASSSAVAQFIVCSDGLATRAHVERVLGSTAELVAARPPATLDELWLLSARALAESGIAERVRLRRPETAEHRELFAELEASVTGLPLYRHVARVAEGAAPLVALWWLAAPSRARDGLPPQLFAELAALLDHEALPPLLASEVELLRSQLEFLLDKVGERVTG